MSSPLDDPEFRRERARKAGRVSSSPEGLAARLVKNWPELTPEQKTKIAAVLRPVVSAESKSEAAS